MSEKLATYMVRIPVELTEELKQFLDERGVDFKPRQQALRMNDAGCDPPVMMGHEAGEVLDDINRFLQARRRSPLVPGDPESWTMLQLHQFLELAMEHFEWEDGIIQPPTGAWWLDQGAPWSEITVVFRELFRKPAGRDESNDE